MQVLHPESAEHVRALQERFPFQGYISETEHRGITFAQLQQLLGFCTGECTRWHDTRSGDVLSVRTLNLYCLNTWVIMPATQQSNCAFVELLTDSRQTPLWFVSHWWGEVIQDFVGCIAEHRRVRHLLDDPYWVCAYANRQHSLHQDLVADPRQTSFFKAMHLAQGILLVLDDKTAASGPATPFTRCWCAFEIFVALTEDADRTGQLLLDIAVTADTRAFLLTDGVAVADQIWQFEWADGVFGNVGDCIQEPFAVKIFGPFNKAVREQAFPVHIMHEGFTFALQQAQASLEVDKRRILNIVVGRRDEELELAPPDSHESYEHINTLLKAVFAHAAWRHLAAFGNSSVVNHNLPSLLARAASKKHVCIELSDLPDISNACVRSVAQGLPASITTLSLGFGGCGSITDDGVAYLAMHLPASVRCLSLNFSKCTLLTDESVVVLAKRLPSSLDHLRLHLDRCPLLTDASVMAISDQFPSTLEYLDLSLDRCPNLTDAALSIFAHQLPHRLLDLTLFIFGCPALTDVGFSALAAQLPVTVMSLRVWRVWPPNAAGNFNSVEELHDWARHICT